MYGIEDILKPIVAVMVVTFFAALPFLAPLYAITFSTILLRLWRLFTGRTIEQNIH